MVSVLFTNCYYSRLPVKSEVSCWTELFFTVYSHGVLFCLDQAACAPIVTQQKLFFFRFSFFQEGLKAAENLTPFVEKLAASVHTVSSQ